VSSHGRIDEYLDGVLADAAMDEFLTHLADCPACQAELHAAIQLRDREDALRAEVGAPPAALDVADAAVEDAPVEEAGVEARPAERPAPVVSLAARRRRVVALVIAGAALAAAVALVILPRGRGGARERAAAAGSSSALALAPTRGLEARLAWSGAADYRRYDADRAGGVRLEAIDPRAIAALAERGDCAGVAAAYLLTGELARAGVQYDRCPGGPDLDADRAALALARGAAAEALALADRALAAQPEHAVARWNRALALRDLGLGLTAAAAFERAAVDPAWSAEARARAAAARAPQGALRTGYAEVVAAGRAMVAGGPPISPALARAFPARARLRLDDAIRVAPTRARLDELRPLATALDGLAGDGLVARLERAQPIAAPPSVVATYVAWVTRGAVDDVAAWRRWRRDAARAGATSLLVGTLLLSGLGADDPALVAEAAGDPWTAALAEVHAAAAEADPAKTDARLTAVEDACARRALPDYPCLRAALERATFESARYRPPTSAAAAADALARIATTGEWAVRWRALYLAGNAARLRGESSLAVAYYDETALASDDCPTQRVAVAMTAAMAVEAGRFAEAAARARTRPACGAPNLFEATLEVDLARAGVPVRPTAEVVTELTALALDDPTTHLRALPVGPPAPRQSIPGRSTSCATWPPAASARPNPVVRIPDSSRRRCWRSRPVARRAGTTPSRRSRPGSDRPGAGALRPDPGRRAGPHRRGRDRSHRSTGRRAGRRRRARRGPACGGRGPRRLRSRRRRGAAAAPGRRARARSGAAVAVRHRAGARRRRRPGPPRRGRRRAPAVGARPGPADRPGRDPAGRRDHPRRRRHGRPGRGRGPGRHAPRVPRPRRAGRRLRRAGPRAHRRTRRLGRHRRGHRRLVAGARPGRGAGRLRGRGGRQLRRAVLGPAAGVSDRRRERRDRGPGAGA
jgi:hypothetical protein